MNVTSVDTQAVDVTKLKKNLEESQLKWKYEMKHVGLSLDQ